VLNYSAPSCIAAIEAFRAGETAKLLLKFAGWFAASEADAEDLLSEAMVTVCDPDHGRPWDPARGSFLAHMRIVLRDLAKRERRSARPRREILDSAMDETMEHAGPAPDEALHDARTAERLRRLGGILRQRISPSPRALQVFDLGCEGVEGADELARALHCSVREVYVANRYIARHAAQVKAEDEAAQAARMKNLRDSAKKKVPT
jgi:DNA-directed RNA polymerase specialized sigma24 family protein